MVISKGIIGVGWISRKTTVRPRKGSLARLLALELLEHVGLPLQEIKSVVRTSSRYATNVVRSCRQMPIALASVK